MASETTARSPGQFAFERFHKRRRAWRRRIWWVLPIAAAAEFAVAAGLGALSRPAHLQFYVGLGVGLAIATVLFVLDSPPHHVERWRQGALGERATARVLRPLVRDGWKLINDVHTGRGNLDHILIGPPGVFLMDSKKLNGVMAVHDGILAIHWHEDRSDGYENRRLAARMKARAAELSEVLRAHGVPTRIWVQPLVVLWGSFDQRSIQSRRVAWVHGPALADVLAARPVALRPSDVDDTTAALKHWLQTISTSN